MKRKLDAPPKPSKRIVGCFYCPANVVRSSLAKHITVNHFGKAIRERGQASITALFGKVPPKKTNKFVFHKPIPNVLSKPYEKSNHDFPVLMK